jgi:hypothetical protein
MTITDVGWRLDRVAISRFHWRVPASIAAGMFFDSSGSNRCDARAAGQFRK